ncbi:type II secretion system protein GspL [Roseateles chitosanitabidus]|uniref:type II secretion system protein GspL n=1 Tax=Roseateles chitosanitabidus TaxID=65048 RepID=UPI00235368CD|nr:type II secretion system protein GspL [Roseateles chitosanitabidus]
MTPVALLRLSLPPADRIEDGAVVASWLEKAGGRDRSKGPDVPSGSPGSHGSTRSSERAARTGSDGTGTWQSVRFDRLAAVAGCFDARRVVLCPHPSDVAMTEIELPPLPAKRQREAVLGALALLTLAEPDQLSVAYGPRNAEGRVPVAWMDAAVLAALVAVARAAGLVVRAVEPPPAGLPAPTGEAAANAVLMEDWVIMRTRDDEGFLHPVDARSHDPIAIEARLRARHPDLAAIQWLSADEPWNGGGWSWSFPLVNGAGAGEGSSWLMPTLAWSTVAAAIAVVGINLQAARLATEGKAVSRQMAADVKAAFPEVPVVLNALQQARQLRDARRNGVIGGQGTGGTPTGAGLDGTDAAALLRASAALLVQAEGQVQALEFQDGQLRVRWRDGSAFGQKDLSALQARAQEKGLAVQSEGHGLRMLADASQPPPTSSTGIRTAQASGGATAKAAGTVGGAAGGATGALGGPGAAGSPGGFGGVVGAPGALGTAP